MKHLARFILVALLFTIPFTACKKEAGIVSDPKIMVEAKNLTDVAYGSDPSQKMDVYLPTNRDLNTKVVIFVHGGSFIEGDKSYFTTLVKELVRAGFAVLNVNYRLVDATGIYDLPVKHLKSAVTIKDQVNDMNTVVDYAIAHAKEWQVSDSKLAIAGHSAGATLALLYAYDVKNTGKVKAVANLAGSLDQTIIDIPFYYFLLPDAIMEVAYRYTGYEVSAATDVYYRAISPLYVANAAQKIPTLNIFPELNDLNGLPKQGRSTFDAFTAKLNSLNVPNKFVMVAGADHEFNKLGAFDTVLNETIAYFNANLN
ncbi:MAG: alpha/beta hydrolase [Bacteroidota bacterium]